MKYRIALKIHIAGKKLELGIGTATGGLEVLKLDGKVMSIGVGFEVLVELK